MIVAAILVAGLVLLVGLLVRDAIRWAVRTDLQGRTSVGRMWAAVEKMGEPKPAAPSPPPPPPVTPQWPLGCIVCNAPSVDGRFCEACRE